MASINFSEVLLLEEELDSNYEPSPEGKQILNAILKFFNINRNKRICIIFRNGPSSRF